MGKTTKGETMTADIFDRVEGYEQFHEILRQFNKLMIEIEKADEFRKTKWGKIDFKIKTPNGIIDFKDIEVESERDIEHHKENISIIFKGK